MCAAILGLGLALGRPIEAGLPLATLAIGQTGLVAGEARPGTHAAIGYTITPDLGTHTVAWGTAPGDATYGTGPSPADFSAGDGGSLWLTVTDGGMVRSTSAPIRYAAPAVSGGLPDTTIGLGSVAAIATAGGFAFSGIPLYSVVQAPPGLIIDPATGEIDASAVATSDATPVVVRLADANDTARFAESGFNLTVIGEISLNAATDAELVVDNATGLVTFTVTSPSYYAGSYEIDTADLATGPISLIAPKIALLTDADTSSNITEGDTLGVGGPDANSYPGLWIYDSDNAPVSIAYQWQRNTAGGWTDSAGATAQTYPVAAADDGAALRLAETATDAAGSRTVYSASLTVEASGPTILLSDDFSTDTIANYDNATDFEIVSGELRAKSNPVRVIYPLTQPTLPAAYYSEVVLGATVPTQLRVIVGRDNAGGADGGLYLNTAGGTLRLQNGDSPWNTIGSATTSLTLSPADTVRLEVNTTTNLATLKVNGTSPTPDFVDVDISGLTTFDGLALGMGLIGSGITSWTVGGL